MRLNQHSTQSDLTGLFTLLCASTVLHTVADSHRHTLNSAINCELLSLDISVAHWPWNEVCQENQMGPCFMSTFNKYHVFSAITFDL
jgi:hypothetical protein